MEESQMKVTNTGIVPFQYSKLRECAAVEVEPWNKFNRERVEYLFVARFWKHFGEVHQKITVMIFRIQ